MQKQSSPLAAGLDPLLASCLWGGMYVVSRASFGQLPPITLGALRVIVGGGTLALVLALSTRRRSARAHEVQPDWRRQDRIRAFVLGVLVAATIVTQFLGTELASAHDGALLTTVTPVFVVPLAWLLL